MLNNNSLKIVKEARAERRNFTNNYLYQYQNNHNGFDTLNYLYNGGYNHTRILYDIKKNESIKSSLNKIIELNSLIPSILSILIGLNREELQVMNNEISNRQLFEYKDYEENIFTEHGEILLNNAKRLCKIYNFNQSEKGPFPHMLEINKSDDRLSPYDCVAKIRNALEHAEYYIDKGDISIINITNSGAEETTFKGRILLWLFRYFVEDYFGHGLGVAPAMETYHYYFNEIKNEEQLIELLKNFEFVRYEFTNIPEHLKFKGNKGLYSKLNRSFSPGGEEITSFDEKLKELSQEGVEYKVEKTKFTDEEIKGILNFIHLNYKDNLYNNEKTFNEIFSLIRLIRFPTKEIANCYNNILRYIDFKTGYLLHKESPDEGLFNQQKSDEKLKYCFETALTFLRINIVNYLLEAKELENPDLSQLEINDIKINSRKELINKMKKAMNDGVKFEESFNYVIINTIRNAMAHGNNRIQMRLDDKIYMIFDDEFNGKHFKIELSLDNLNKIYSNDIFNPKNIKVKQKEKQLTKTI